MMNQLNLIKRGRSYQSEIRYALTPESVYDAARKGLTLTDIAKALGVSRPTIRNVLDEREDLQVAWEKGHTELLAELCDHMIERAFQNDIILMFLLKTRFNFVEYQHIANREAKEEAPKINIYLPDNQRDMVETD